MVIVTTGTVIIEVVRLIALHGLRDAIRQAGGRTLTGLVLLGIASIMNVVRGDPVEREDNDSHTQSLALEQVTAGLSAALILDGIREVRRRQIMLAVGDDVPAKLSEQSMETAMLLVSAQGRQLEVSGELHAKVSRLCDEVMKYESLNATALPCSSVAGDCTFIRISPCGRFRRCCRRVPKGPCAGIDELACSESRSHAPVRSTNCDVGNELHRRDVFNGGVRFEKVTFMSCELT